MANVSSKGSGDKTSEHVQIISMSNGRQMHYASAGNSSAKTVILMFSGYLSVGTAWDSSIPEPFNRDGIHWVAPTIPGNGQSSSTPRGVSYHHNLCEMITELLEQTHPSDNSKDNAIARLYIAGGSYGSVPCQMLYGAPFSRFPYGRKIAGMMLLAPFSPFKYHKDYDKQMTWANWISVGPPSRWVPFRIIPRLLSTVLASKCKTLESTKILHDQLLFAKMNDKEKQQLETYAKEKRGITSDQLKEEMAKSCMKCTTNWDGLLEGPDVLHSDWGFEPAKLDEEHSKPVLVVMSSDDELGDGIGTWLVGNYKHARLREIEGGHIAALYQQDALWTELVGMVEAGGH